MSGHLDRSTTWLPESIVLIALAECLQVVEIMSGQLSRPTCQFIKPKRDFVGAATCRLTGRKEETSAHWRHLAPDWRYILVVNAGH